MTDRLTFDDDGTLDELVMTDALVHLEHLGDGEYMLIAANTADHVHLNLTVRRRFGIPAVRLYERFTPTNDSEGTPE